MSDKSKLDDFWSIDKLVPKKKSNMASFSSVVKTSDFTVDADEKTGGSEERKLNFASYTAENSHDESYSYAPVSNKLIKRVTVHHSIDKFDFYGTFRKAALIYFDYKCDKCDFVPFYSYMPQYTQMTTEQKKYYFFWRDMLRRGKYIKTDYSYVYLYAYEILNLPDKISKEEGLRLLVDVFKTYREALPVLDNNFTVWLEDYCLLYGLDYPKDELAPFMFNIVSKSRLKEFYVSDISSMTDAVGSLLAYLSDYDWRSGKYATADNSDAYRKHVEGAMSGVLSRLFSDSGVTSGETAVIRRNAFPGSLCTHLVKKTLEIEYYPIADTPTVRAGITAAVKYTENKLRAALGVKSRLAVKELPEDYRNEIDRYFTSIFERINRERRRASQPEYEKLYDAPESSVSIEDAIKIERSSWRVTEDLVRGTEAELEYFAEAKHSETYDVQKVPANDPTEQNTAEESSQNENSYGLSQEELVFLRALCASDVAEAKKMAVASAGDAATVVESINEKFADNFGDVIIEPTELFYAVIDDYKEEITEWIRENTR